MTDPWAFHKATIRRLYLNEGRNLKELRSVMTNPPYELKGSIWQYEQKLRDWGFTKNLKKSDWPAIHYHLGKRKRDGKESEVFLNDVRIPQKKIKKETARNRIDPLRRADIPLLPLGVEIRSPKLNAHSLNHVEIEASSDPGDSFTTTAMPEPRSPTPIFSLTPSFVSELEPSTDLADLTNLQCISADPLLGCVDLSTSSFEVSHDDDAEPFSNTALMAFLQSDFNNPPPVSEQCVLNQDLCSKYNFLIGHNIPWICFYNLIKPDPYTGLILNTNPSYFTALLQKTVPFDQKQELVQRFFEQYDFYDIMDGTARVSHLQTLIPSEIYGTISTKVHKFFSLSPMPAIEVIEIATCLLSNNLLSNLGATQFLQWIQRHMPRELLRFLFQKKSLTVQAVQDKLLEAVSKCGDEADLHALIDSQIPKASYTGERGTRLWRLARIWQNNRISNALINLGITPDTYSITDEPSIFTSSIDTTPLSEEGLLQNDVYGLNGFTAPLAAHGQSGEATTYALDIIKSAEHGLFHLKRYLDVTLKNSVGGKTINSEHQPFVLQTALRTAVDEANHRAVKTLLDFGVPPNLDAAQPKELFPLFVASQLGDIEMAKLLLDAGADLDAPGVLVQAASTGRSLKFLLFLIEQGASSESSGEAFEKAISQNNMAAAKVLLRSGIGLEATNSKGENSLHIAVKHSVKPQMIRHLVQLGVNINSVNPCNGYTALHYAVEANNLELVDLLLQLNAKLQPDTHAPPLGKTLLEVCSEKEHCGNKENTISKQIFHHLLGYGAPINGPPIRKRCQDWNSTLTNLILLGDKELIQTALNSGADIHQLGVGERSQTPLQAAAAMGDIELAKDLLNRGAKINAPAGYIGGRTALQAACESDIPRPDMVQFLIQQGADVNADPGIERGATALQFAAMEGHMKIVIMLLQAGADVNAEPAEIEGRMALDGAAEHGRLDIVQVLLNQGARSEGDCTGGGGKAVASTDVTGHYGLAIELATRNFHFAVADLLRNPFTGCLQGL